MHPNNKLYSQKSLLQLKRSQPQDHAMKPILWPVINRLLIELTSRFIHVQKILSFIIEYVTTGRIFQSEFSIFMKSRDHFDLNVGGIQGWKKFLRGCFFLSKNWNNFNRRSFVTFFGVWRRPIYSSYIYVRVKDGPNIADWSQRILQKYQRNIIKHAWIRASSLWSSSCRNQSIFVRPFLGKVLI